MYDDGDLSDGVMIEWLKSHTNGVYQPRVGDKAHAGFNPYALGVAMFTGQYLSPKLMRDFRLFAIHDDEQQSELEVCAIHDDAGYRRVREALSQQYDLGSREPNIQVWNVNLRGDRSLTLRHFQHRNRPLAEGAQEVLKHVARLWGFGVQLESSNAIGDITQRWTVPAPSA